MAAHKTDKRNILYANLMEEVKLRFDCINLAVEGRIGYAPPILREVCWLQIRMLCELIALSCLVAHGDIAALQSHKIGKAYSADEILDRLAKLRPHFYPIPIVQKLTNPEAPVGKRSYNTTAVDPSPLPKADLISLYGKTHRHLHRGSLKKLLSMDVPIDTNVNFPEIVEHAQKMSGLLSNHMIAVSENHLILCMLKNASNNNRVQVVTAEKNILK